MKIGDTINNKTILWMDNPSELMPFEVFLEQFKTK